LHGAQETSIAGIVEVEAVRLLEADQIVDFLFFALLLILDIVDTAFSTLKDGVIAVSCGVYIRVQDTHADSTTGVETGPGFGYRSRGAVFQTPADVDVGCFCCLNTC